MTGVKRQTADGERQKRPRRMIGLVLALGFVVLAVVLYRSAVSPTLDYARVATAFGAKKVCSCLHVAGMGLDQCLVDFTDDVSAITFTAEGESVRADVLGGFISGQAVYREGLGCTLVPDES